MANYVIGGYTTPAGVTDQEGVRRVQRQLNEGGANLKVDGIWGPKTDAAYRAQQGGTDTLGQSMQQMISYLQPDTLSYTPQSTEVLKAQLESALRPTVDAAIASRKEATELSAAALDADAWPRGMGRSTYVTDVKSRQQQDEADDIARMEDTYEAELAKRLMDAVNAEQERALSAAQYNAEQQNAAKKLAFSAAHDAYGNAAVQAKSGKQSGNGSSVVATSPENCRKFLASLTPEERKNVYDGVTEEDRICRAELIASLGRSGYVAIQEEFPPSE